jgi:hypothetical protein
MSSSGITGVDVDKAAMIASVPRPGRTRWAVFNPKQDEFYVNIADPSFDPMASHIYVAIGDPGVIDVVDARNLRVIQTVSTEAGAHTIGFDGRRSKVYAFLPTTHSAAVYEVQS